jgi:3-deoxy-7-phosphoheptulonate synthase
VLRGGGGQTNFHAEAITSVAAELKAAALPDRVMVDCSHGNSNKDYRRQSEVLTAVADQVRHGSTSVLGVMLESNLVEGNQKLPADLSQLAYGQSITDACIDLTTTEQLLEQLAAAVPVPVA